MQAQKQRKTLLKPLRLGVELVEIPTRWKARKEGKSHAALFDGIMYLKLGISILLQQPKEFLK